MYLFIMNYFWSLYNMVRYFNTGHPTKKAIHGKILDHVYYFRRHLLTTYGVFPRTTLKIGKTQIEASFYYMYNNMQYATFLTCPNTHLKKIQAEAYTINDTGFVGSYETSF